jgi:hypothetical protein
MTAALLDRRATASAAAPAPSLPLPGAVQAPQRRRRRPHLMPVPDCEPPLRSAQDDDPMAPSNGVRGVAALFAGDAPAPGVAPPQPWRGAVTAPPPMTHRRWPVDLDLRREPRAESGTDLPHRVHSAVGAVAADDDATWPAVTLPPELSHRPRSAAFATATMLARATIEALAGLRPIVQLEPYYAAGVFAGLQDFPMLGHRRDTQLVSLWVCEPTDNSAEISVTFRCGPRTRAMAMQLRAQRDRWFVTSLQLG